MKKYCEPKKLRQVLLMITVICLVAIVSLQSSLTALSRQFLSGWKVFWVASTPSNNSSLNFTFSGENKTVSNESTTIKEIIPVTKPIFLMNNPRWSWFHLAVEELKSCEANCNLSKSGRNLTGYDAVIFYAVGYTEELPPPKIRGQIWIFFTIESPQHTSGKQFKNKEWREKFNWTMTYRLDADVPYPYGRINKRKTPVSFDFSDVVKHKTKLAAWFVSNCKTPSRREEYVRELKKFISVDIYGRCGDKKCHNTKDNCNLLLTRDYKFYLAFENSFCYDYVTEKSFHYMELDIVLVVRGGANYTKFLPPKSYINTADFKSPKHLAEYLLYLNKNDTAYVEFLEWKKYYTSGKSHVGICELCKKLHNPVVKEKVYPDIHSWYFVNKCFPPKDLH